MQINVNFKLILFLLIWNIPYYVTAEETIEITDTTTSSEEITIDHPTNEDIQPLLQSLNELYKEKTWEKDNWGFMNEKLISPTGKEYKVFSEFIEHWQEYKKYTPTELHFFFDTIYTNYQTTEHKKEYLELVTQNSIQSLHAIIKTMQIKEPSLLNKLFYPIRGITFLQVE